MDILSTEGDDIYDPLNVLQPEQLVSCQSEGLVGNPGRVRLKYGNSGEMKLIAAIIIQAWYDLGHKRRRGRPFVAAHQSDKYSFWKCQARAWLDDKSEEPWSFKWCQMILREGK